MPVPRGSAPALPQVPSATGTIRDLLCRALSSQCPQVPALQEGKKKVEAALQGPAWDEVSQGIQEKGACCQLSDGCGLMSLATRGEEHQQHGSSLPLSF